VSTITLAHASFNGLSDVLSSGAFFVSKQFFERSISMKTYQKLFIGITAICLFAVCTVPADAASPAKAATKIAVKAKDFITQTGTSLGNVIWQNKGSIAVGTAAVAVATNPAPFVEGATTIITGKPAKIVIPANYQVTGYQSAQSVTGSLWYYLFYAGVTILCIVGVRCAWSYVKDYKNWLPLMVVGVLLCSVGVVEAAVITSPPPVLPPVFISPIPWWNIVNFVLLVVSIFI
jgi:hypothetical protein